MSIPPPLFHAMASGPNIFSFAPGLSPASSFSSSSQPHGLSRANHRNVGAPFLLGTGQSFSGATVFPEEEMSWSRPYSLKRLVAFLGGGVAMGVAGLAVWRRLRPPAVKQVIEDAVPIHEVQNWLQVEGIPALIRLFMIRPDLRPPILQYASVGALGYVADSAVQGAQEAWVRLEESRIRFHLLSDMTSIYEKSIRQKEQFDTQLRAQATSQIQSLLRAYGISNPEAYIQRIPSPIESLETNRRYLHEPTHRRFALSKERFPSSVGLMFGSVFGVEEQREGKRLPNDALPQRRVGLFEIGLTGVGALLGGLLHAFIQSLSSSHITKQLENGQQKLHENLSIKGMENLFLILKDKRTLLGSLLLLGIARVGKLFLDGTREIQVTQLNAATEKRFQHYKQVSLDPQYYHIAEQSALNQSLQALEGDMPALSQAPEQLRNRVQTILTNIGRNAAPKYWPMTPNVGLVLARS